MAFTLKNKQILLIEDYSVMRASIREMLYTLDAQHIHETTNGSNSIESMLHKPFDIVLCDYNLGKGKNGLNILEEARHRNLLPHSCVFIMVTAEQNPGMVLGAMEYKPDDYLTKPFTSQQLCSRLQRSYARKQYISSVTGEMANNNLFQAIENCDKLLKKPGKQMRSELLKLRADLALKSGDYVTAKAIVEGVLQQRQLNWASLTLGKIHYLQQDLTTAAEIFEDLIAQNPMLMEAYDWLAKIYEANDELTHAQDILCAAVEISPQTILRQKKLAIIADRTGNLDVAKNAYHAAVNLGKQSIHKSSSDYSGLAKTFQRSDAHVDALNTLNDMRQEFLNDMEANLRAAALETEIFQQLGDSKKSERAFNNALSLSQQLDAQAPRDLRLDMAKACYLNNNQESAENIIHALIQNNIDDAVFLETVKSMYESLNMHNEADDIIERTKRELIEINNTGIKLFKQAKFSQAIAVLKEALSKMPENKTILFNIIKILLHDMSDSGCSAEKLQQTRQYLDTAIKLGVAEEKIYILKIQLHKLELSSQTTS